MGGRPRRWRSGRVRRGTHVRLSGQDSGRGTFSHRHAVLVDQETRGALRPDQPHPRGRPFEIIDSPLSEAAVSLRIRLATSPTR